MASTITADQQLYREFARTAPRLDLEFFVKRNKMSFELFNQAHAMHWTMVQDEPKGRNHGKHLAALRCFQDRVRSWQLSKDPIGYWAPLLPEWRDEDGRFLSDAELSEQSDAA